MNNCKCGCLNIKVVLEDESVNIPIEIGNPIEHIVIPDVYEGNYDIAPSTEEIILQTKDKTLTNDITVESIPDEYIVPQGTKVIKEGGIYDIKQYEIANVLTNIQSLSVMPSEQAQTFTLNNESISGYNPVVVNPIPSEYIIPTGVETINIIENGTISKDVTNKETVTVNVDVQNEDYDNALTAFGVQSDLADGINALTEYSNEITGEQDENLSDAVRTLVDGYIKNGVTLDGMADGSEPVIHNPIINVTEVRRYAFDSNKGISGSISLPNAVTVRTYAFNGCDITEVYAPVLQTYETDSFSFSGNAYHQPVHLYFDTIKKFCTSGLRTRAPIILHTPMVEEFETMCFNGSYGVLTTNNGFIIVPATVKKVGSDITRNTYTDCKGYKFYGKPNEINSDMVGSSRGSVRDIYVPWSEGEVLGAPWGGTNATVHYNTVYDENGNIISST